MIRVLRGLLAWTVNLKFTNQLMQGCGGGAAAVPELSFLMCSQLTDLLQSRPHQLRDCQLVHEALRTPLPEDHRLELSKDGVSHMHWAKDAATKIKTCGLDAVLCMEISKLSSWEKEHLLTGCCVDLSHLRRQLQMTTWDVTDLKESNIPLAENSAFMALRKANSTRNICQWPFIWCF